MKPGIGNDCCHPRRTFVNTCDTAPLILSWICTIASFAAASQHYSQRSVASPHQCAIELMKAHAFIAVNTTSRFTGALINSARDGARRRVCILAVDTMPVGNKISNEIACDGHVPVGIDESIIIHSLFYLPRELIVHTVCN